MDNETLAKSIEENYEKDFLRPFPLEEVEKLKSIAPEAWDSFHAYLTLFFADIAGLCARATRLSGRPEHELARAWRIVRLPFFQRYPDVQPFESHITKEAVPELFENLELVELRRQQLATLLELPSE